MHRVSKLGQGGPAHVDDGLCRGGWIVIALCCGGSIVIGKTRSEEATDVVHAHSVRRHLLQQVRRVHATHGMIGFGGRVRVRVRVGVSGGLCRIRDRMWSGGWSGGCEGLRDSIRGGVDAQRNGALVAGAVVPLQQSRDGGAGVPSVSGAPPTTLRIRMGVGVRGRVR